MTTQTTTAAPAAEAPVMTISIGIPHQRINDLLTQHSGLMSEWIGKLSPVNSSGLSFYVEYDDPDEDEGSFTGRKTVEYTDIQNGLNLMASKSPRDWAKFMAEDDDDITFDVAWQYIILGDIIYG